MRIAVRVQEKPPTDRTRVRRLADRDALLSLGSVSVGYNNSRYALIWLSNEQKDPSLPIAVGNSEAKSIASELPQTRVKLPRGYGGKAAREKGWAYDLLKTVLDAFEIVHERAVIDLLHANTFKKPFFIWIEGGLSIGVRFFKDAVKPTGDGGASSLIGVGIPCFHL